MVKANPWVSELGIIAGEPKIKTKEKKTRPASLTAQFGADI